MDFHKLKFTCVLKAAERMFFCWKKQWPGCHLCLGRMMRVCRYLLNFPLNWVKFFLLENAWTCLSTRAPSDKILTWSAVCCGSHRNSLIASALLVFVLPPVSDKILGDFSFFNVFWFYVTSYGRSLWIRYCRVINTQYPGYPYTATLFSFQAACLLLICCYSSCLFYWFGFLVLGLRILNICKYLLWALSVLLNCLSLVYWYLHMLVCGVFLWENDACCNLPSRQSDLDCVECDYLEFVVSITFV